MVEMFHLINLSLIIKPRVYRTKIIIIGCIFLLSDCSSHHHRSSTEKPNILFILVDDLGWRDTGAYGSSFYETPNIDTLARQGMKFTDAYANSPVCSPSRYAIQTGKYPADIHLTDWILGWQNRRGVQSWQQVVDTTNQKFMPLSSHTFAEVLQDAGYKTFFAGKWHLVDDTLYWPENQGYDINKGGWAAGSPVAHGGGGYFSPYHNPRLKDGPKGEYLPNRLTDETIHFINKEAEKDAPFLAFLSFYSVHTPLQSKTGLIKKYKAKASKQGLNSKKTYDRSKEWMQKNKRWKERLVQSNSIYAGMVESVDKNIGRLLQTLQNDGLKDNTVVIFFSDNGGLAVSSTTNLPLKYGKGWTYEGGMRVPMIVRWPHQIQPGSVSHLPVSGVDWYPTLLQMVGVNINTHTIDGQSLVSVLKGKSVETLKNRPVFWHYPHYHGAGGRPSSVVRKGNYKLIKFWENDHVELYNLEKDISEQNNLADAMPQKACKMEQLLMHWLHSTDAQIPKKNTSYESKP